MHSSSNAKPSSLHLQHIANLLKPLHAHTSDAAQATQDNALKVKIAIRASFIANFILAALQVSLPSCLRLERSPRCSHRSSFNLFRSNKSSTPLYPPSLSPSSQQPSTPISTLSPISFSTSYIRRAKLSMRRSGRWVEVDLRVVSPFLGRRILDSPTVN